MSLGHETDRHSSHEMHKMIHSVYRSRYFSHLDNQENGSYCFNNMTHWKFSACNTE